MTALASSVAVPLVDGPPGDVARIRQAARDLAAAADLLAGGAWRIHADVVAVENGALWCGPASAAYIGDAGSCGNGFAAAAAALGQASACWLGYADGLAAAQMWAARARAAADLLGRERDRLADEEHALAAARASPSGYSSWSAVLEATAGDTAELDRLQAWATRLRAEARRVRSEVELASRAAHDAATQAAAGLDAIAAGTRDARRAAADRVRASEVAAGLLPAEDGSLRSRLAGFADGLADDVTGTLGLLGGLVGLQGDPRPHWAELGDGVVATVRDPGAAVRAAVDWTDVEQGDWGHWAGSVGPSALLTLGTAGGATLARTSRVLDALSTQEAVAARIHALRDAAELHELGRVHREWGALFSPIVPGGGLAAHELDGGHVIARHVGLLEKQLRARLRQPNPVYRASTFLDRRSAELFVSEALRRRSDEVVAWLGRPNRQAELDFVVPMGQVTGLTLRPRWDAPRPVTAVKVVLVPARTPEGWRIKTAFPCPAAGPGTP